MPRYRDLSPQEKMKAKERFKRPPFSSIFYNPKIFDLGKSTLNYIRGNTLLIRPYRPTGYRQNGLWVARNDKHPPIFGHVIGLPYNSWHLKRYDFQLGDQIMYDRFSDEEIEQVDMDEPMFDGEKTPICILGMDSVTAIFRPALVELRK